MHPSTIVGSNAGRHEQPIGDFVHSECEVELTTASA
jgi:hypothetical protein